jgi:mono/diheme cytochrome c family protein
MFMTTTKLILLSTVALVGCRTEAATERETPKSATKAAPTEAELAKRGEHLVLVSGCHDCHTPLKMTPNGPAPDFERALSGHPEGMVMPPAPALPPGPWLVTVAATNTAWSGPWGVSFTANLTPDNDTGTGTWSRQNFIETIRNGKHMGAGRPLLPPMPAAMYAHYSDEDLGAIFAYTRTIAAIKNKVPTPLPPAPPQAAMAEKGRK